MVPTDTHTLISYAYNTFLAVGIYILFPFLSFTVNDNADLTGTLECYQIYKQKLKAIK